MGSWDIDQVVSFSCSTKNKLFFNSSTENSTDATTISYNEWIVFYKPLISDKMYEKTPPGVCLGLAWTSHGGSTLYIETIKQRSSRNDKEDAGSIGKAIF